MRRNRSANTPPRWQLHLRAVMRGLGMVLLLLVAAQLFTYLARSVIQPLIVYRQKVAEHRVLSQQVETMRRQVEEQHTRRSWWTTPIGKEELARQRAMLVRPGEQTVVVTPPAPSPEPPVVVDAVGATLSPMLCGAVLALVMCAVIGGMLLRRRRLIKVRQQVGVLTPRNELLRQRPGMER